MRLLSGSYTKSFIVPELFLIVASVLAAESVLPATNATNWSMCASTFASRSSAAALFCYNAPMSVCKFTTIWRLCWHLDFWNIYLIGFHTKSHPCGPEISIFGQCKESRKHRIQSERARKTFLPFDADVDVDLQLLMVLFILNCSLRKSVNCFLL